MIISSVCGCVVQVCVLQGSSRFQVFPCLW